MPRVRSALGPVPAALGLLVALGAFACATGSPSGGPDRPGARAVEYRMVAHPVSGVEMPRIRLPERPEIEQQVNARLDAEAARLRCLRGGGGSWNASVWVAYAADDVFSVGIASNFYCGGAHPMLDADSSVTFDLRTGRGVPFRSLFEDYERDSAELRRAYVRNLAAEERERCEDVLTVEALEGHGFVYTVTEHGLHMRTSFPHVLEACNRTAVVPFGELRPFARPGGILLRLADAPGRA